MIIVALGANLNHPEYGSPQNTLTRAVKALEVAGLKIVKQSSWYGTAPVPISDQPWFINGVVQIETELDPEALLMLLHATEEEFGRVRTEKWAARILDLDLISYNDLVTVNRDQRTGLVIPHPLMTERAFVLRPLSEILPNWADPVTGMDIKGLIAQLPEDQPIKRLG
ncbi:2-amino-4-hydroxy-6-hydroxymethyldihydropteridine diphosphokinase [Sneathiella limimaris]|uniref:2-amino-4-hydroxy-6- hydroxymethyldihydropteridine diphosphokinase n=1 Tax=Sneathiella limimaris TaxID=1964213 RepID=UPI00146BC694|nr:2-amino-4-hydroxy-6-hydroxymethyldihydropteridine diphosphokinase [Sneathiella limimaris]